MTDQPNSPEGLAPEHLAEERLADLASQPAGGPDEARLGAEQQAEVEEQRAVRRALSSLPAPQLTPEERRDLRRAAHRAAAEESAAPAPPARRRFRLARAWPAAAAVASLALAVAVAINLRDLGDTANQRAEAPVSASTAAPTVPPTTMTAFADGPVSEEAPLAAAEPESATADAGAAAEDQMAESDPLPPPASTAADETADLSTEESATESASMSYIALDDLPRLWGTDEGTWESARELAERTKALAAGQPDVFPMSYPEMAEYADRTGLACWDGFADNTDGGRATVAFAGRAWIGEFWYEVYHLETEEPLWEGGPRYLLIAFTPPGGLAGTAGEDEADDECWALFITEQETEG